MRRVDGRRLAPDPLDLQGNDVAIPKKPPKLETAALADRAGAQHFARMKGLGAADMTN